MYLKDEEENRWWLLCVKKDKQLKKIKKIWYFDKM